MAGHLPNSPKVLSQLKEFFANRVKKVGVDPHRNLVKEKETFKSFQNILFVKPVSSSAFVHLDCLNIFFIFLCRAPGRLPFPIAIVFASLSQRLNPSKKRVPLLRGVLFPTFRTN